jgi:RHS repeat-associated protein
MTYYFGPFIHEGTQAGTSSLKYILTTEGRILNVGTDLAPIWKWEYDLKDHLGNVRVVVSPHATPGYATLLQENNYYPFGMRMSEICTNSGTCTNQYKYNGKELQTDFGLNWYDYGARFYDPQIGRWTTVDPLCEDGGQESVTPYGYVFNDPIKHNDPDGRFPLLSNLVGAVAGALVEYGGQVAANVYENGWSTSAFTDNIDVGDIGFASGEGFLTSGGSIVKNALVKTTVVFGLKLLEISWMIKLQVMELDLK